MTPRPCASLVSALTTAICFTMLTVERSNDARKPPRAIELVIPREFVMPRRCQRSVSMTSPLEHVNGPTGHAGYSVLFFFGTDSLLLFTH